MQAQLFEKVVKAISKVSGNDVAETISPMSKLRDDLGLDSMSSLTFLMELEESIDGFVVDPRTLDFSDLECVRSITHYVERQLARE